MKTYRVEVVWVGDPKHKDFGVVTQSHSPVISLNTSDAIAFALCVGAVRVSGPDFAVRAVEVPNG